MSFIIKLFFVFLFFSCNFTALSMEFAIKKETAPLHQKIQQINELINVIEESNRLNIDIIDKLKEELKIIIKEKNIQKLYESIEKIIKNYEKSEFCDLYIVILKNILKDSQNKNIEVEIKKKLKLPTDKNKLADHIINLLKEGRVLSVIQIIDKSIGNFGTLKEEKKDWEIFALKLKEIYQAFFIIAKGSSLESPKKELKRIQNELNSTLKQIEHFVLSTYDTYGSEEFGVSFFQDKVDKNLKKEDEEIKENKNLMKMGLEIETSLIKVVSGYKGFGVFDELKEIWKLEADTRDAKGNLWNLEAKTIGGCDFELFSKRVDETVEVLNGIFIHINEKEKNFLDAIELNISLVEKLIKNNYLLMNFDQIKVEKWLEGSIRPQITYQIPLKFIPHIFDRIKSKGFFSRFFFLSFDAKKNQLVEEIILNTLEELENESKSLPNKSMLQKEIEKYKEKFQVLSYLIKQKIPTYVTNFQDENLKGFSYLFLYYWCCLFNNGESDSKETGPKSQLAVMSRIPFSEMYDKLSLNSQETFKKLFSNSMNSNIGNNYLISYIDDNQNFIENILTLKEWYQSIVNKEERKQQNEDSSSEEESFDQQQISFNKALLNKKIVDKLSPPPGNFDSYSMGYLNLEKAKEENLALIELRCYSGSWFKEKKDKKNFLKLKEFLNEESNWFFKEFKK